MDLISSSLALSHSIQPLFGIYLCPMRRRRGGSLKDSKKRRLLGLLQLN